MENHSEKAIIIKKAVKTRTDEAGETRIKDVVYETNIEAGDIIQRLIIFGDVVTRTENYQVSKVHKKSMWVDYKVRDGVRSGTIDIDQLAGAVLPGVKGIIIVQFKLLKKS